MSEDMKPMLLGCLLGSMLVAAQPLRVVGVVRSGMPPFEEGERLYRLEGEGCPSLAPGELLTLRREGERRNLGRLQITVLKDGYALAQLAIPGETYPLKGDLAVRHEKALPLPAIPDPWAVLAIPSEAMAPRQPKLAIPSSPLTDGGHREPIYFLKGNAELSSAARIKLRAWVSAWGLDGRWILLIPALPEIPAAITQARVEALKEALKGLGVGSVEQQSLPSTPPARYDSISVSKTSW